MVDKDLKEKQQQEWRKKLTFLELPKQHEILNLPFYMDLDKALSEKHSFAYMFKGVAGTGKTELLRIIAAHIKCEELFAKPKIISMPKIWGEYYDIMLSNYDDKADAMRRRVDFFREEAVLIDDLGAEADMHKNAVSYFSMQALTTLYDSYTIRKNKGMPYKYIITSNTTATKDREIYGDRIYDRFLEMFTIVTFPGIIDEKSGKYISFRERNVEKIDLGEYKGE